MVSVIIVTYNGLRWINKCLSSIYNNCESIIVVDNASTDETVSFIKKTFPQVMLIALKKNIGFGAANNLAIKKAIKEGGDYFLLINQDVYIEYSNVLEMLSSIKRYPEVGIISPLHLNGAGTSFDRGFLSYLYSGSKGEFVNSLYFNKRVDIFKVPFVNAAAWLITRRCIEKVGLFEELFYHYGEDYNYCQRVLYHGFTIAIDVNAIALHDREWRNGMAPEFLAQEELRSVLIGLCDPCNNPEEEVNKYIKGKRRQLIKQLIRLDFKGYKKNKENLNFIKEKKTIIIHNTASKKGSNSTDFAGE